MVLMSRMFATLMGFSTIALGNRVACAEWLSGTIPDAVVSPVSRTTAQRVIPPPGTPPTWRYPQKVRSISYQTYDQAVIALSPDGTTVVGGDRSTLTVWEVATGRPLRTLSSFSTLQTDASLSSLAFSPDGRTVAASLYDARSGHLRVNVWNVATGELRHRLGRRITPHFLGERPNQPAMPENWSTIAFSPDSRRLVSVAGGSEQITIWDLASGQLVQTLRGGRGPTITFSQDGRQLARSNGNQLLIWNLANPRSPQSINYAGEVVGFVFSSDNRLLYVAARESLGNTPILVQRRELNSSKPADQLFAYHWSSTVTFSPNAKTLIAGSPNNMMAIADLQTGQTLANPEEYFSWGSATTFSQDGRTFAVVLGNQTIRIWQMGSANQVSGGRQYES